MKFRPYTISLSEQMAVCDANYIRLLKLLGNTRSLNRRLVAMPQIGIGANREQVSVSIEVVEDFKYTSTVSVKQLLTKSNIGKSSGKNSGKSSDNVHSIIKDKSALYKAPEMTIRVYHDAKTAEVMSYQNQKYFKAVYPVPNRLMYQRDEKEQLNLFLADWLNLCINEGLGDLEEMSLEKLTCF
jgi:uncharacterized protein